MRDETTRVNVTYDAAGNVIPLNDDAFAQTNFGDRVAKQMNASVEVDTDEVKAKTSASDNTCSKDARQTKTNVIDYRQKLQAMSFDERVEATIECLGRRSSFRDILYGLLDFCFEEKTYEDIEPYVESFTEFHRNRQQPRRYVFMLLRCGALEEIELGEDGNPLTETDKQEAIENGLDPEDLDLLVSDWRIVTTDVGRKVHADFSPSMRLEKLIEEYPEREEAFIQIMTFCREPQFMGAIDDKFKGSSLMGIDKIAKQKHQPSSYVEKLDMAGGITWNGNAWSLTDAGKEYLESQINIR